MAREGTRGRRGFREARLAQTYDLRGKWVGVLDPESVKLIGEFVVAWEQMGLNGEGLLSHLLEAAWSRVEYEEEQREIAAEKLMGKRGRRRDLATIAGRGPLVELMQKSRATVPGSPRENLAEAVESWAKQYVANELTMRAKKLARGKPGEPWLREPVIHLAGQLRRVGQSWNRTLHLIYEAFCVIGMGGVVTRDKVRHRIRAERQRRPGFGRGAGEPCKLCWGTSGIGKVLQNAYKFRESAGPALIQRLIQNPRDKRILQKYRQQERKIRKRLLRQRALLHKKILHPRKRGIG